MRRAPLFTPLESDWRSMGCMTKSKTKVVVLVYHFRWYCCWFCVCVFVFVSKTPLELWSIFHWNRKWIEFVFAGGLRVPLLLTLSSSLGCCCLHWKQRKADVRRHGDSHLSAVFGLLEIGPCHWPFLPRVAPKAVRVLVCCLSFGFSCCFFRSRKNVSEREAFVAQLVDFTRMQLLVEVIGDP